MQVRLLQYCKTVIGCVGEYIHMQMKFGYAPLMIGGKP